jgi:hypothetical protein
MTLKTKYFEIRLFLLEIANNENFTLWLHFLLVVLFR